MSRPRSITGLAGLLLLALGVFLLADYALKADQLFSPDSGWGELFVASAIVPILLIRARLKLDAKDPFRLYAGDDTYVLHHVTGPVEGANKMAISDVHGGGGTIRVGRVSTDIMGNVSGGGGGGVIKPVETTTTIRDQFFIHRSDGYVAPVKLENWDVSVADGQLVTAVLAIRQGDSSGPYLAVRNHSTRDFAYPAGAPFVIERRGRMGMFVVLALVGFLLAGAYDLVFAHGTTSSSTGAPAFLVVAVGIVAGIVLWSRLIQPGFWRRWVRHDADRVRSAVDALAAAATPGP